MLLTRQYNDIFYSFSSEMPFNLILIHKIFVSVNIRLRERKILAVSSSR
jgi:hypothetical protein